MSKIIVYGSYYGTTKSYATELSKRTGIEAISYDKVKDLASYDTILYIGGLYAGGVLGLNKTIKQLSVSSEKEIFIVTVGLADPKDIKNIKSIRESISRQIPESIFEHVKIFHLRGGIDYQKLNFLHRTMMKLLYNKVKRIPTEKQDAETKGIIETYNQQVDFVDFNSLNDIIKMIL